MVTDEIKETIEGRRTAYKKMVSEEIRVRSRIEYKSWNRTV